MATEQEAREAGEKASTEKLPISLQEEFTGYGAQLVDDAFHVVIYTNREPELCSDAFFDAMPIELKTRAGVSVPVTVVNLGDLQPQ